MPRSQFWDPVYASYTAAGSLAQQRPDTDAIDRVLQLEVDGLPQAIERLFPAALHALLLATLPRCSYLDEQRAALAVRAISVSHPHLCSGAEAALKDSCFSTESVQQVLDELTAKLHGEAHHHQIHLDVSAAHPQLREISHFQYREATGAGTAARAAAFARLVADHRDRGGRTRGPRPVTDGPTRSQP